MKTTDKTILHSLLFAALLALGHLPWTSAIAYAQAPTTPAAGNNAVFGSAAACSPSGCIASPAFIDASVLTGSDLCAKINAALTAASYPAAGAVIDARGIGSGTTQSCPSGTPWGASTHASTILLPAGTIQISNAWTLPDSTRLIGMGPGITTIQATSNVVTMLTMGSTTSHQISIEDLTLDGNGFSGLIGISNSNAKELSYVKHVNLYRIPGTGLAVSGNAQNSGPYSDIAYNAAGLTTTAATACVKITVSTRGIHTLSCISGATTSPTAAVYLGGSNNSIADVKISGFNNGIMIGQNGVAQSNILRNISSDGTVGTLVGTGVIRICGSACTAHSTITDLTLMGIATGGTGNSIRDELVNTTLTDSTVGIYILGKSVAVGAATGYSRFTTSKNTATWGVGNLGSAAPTAADCTNTTGRNTTGSLFSNTSTSGTASLYVCSGSAWVVVK